jgi:hypothetical protein
LKSSSAYERITTYPIASSEFLQPLSATDTRRKCCALLPGRFASVVQEMATGSQSRRVSAIDSGVPPSVWKRIANQRPAIHRPHHCQPSHKEGTGLCGSLRWVSLRQLSSSVQPSRGSPKGAAIQWAVVGSRQSPSPAGSLLLYAVKFHSPSR